MNDLALASLIFSVTYLLIISERIHKTTAALAGGLVMIAFRVLAHRRALAGGRDIIGAGHWHWRER